MFYLYIYSFVFLILIHIAYISAEEKKIRYLGIILNIPILIFFFKLYKIIK